MLRYSFDTSSLLNGRRDLLPPTVFASVWEDIESMIGDGAIRAVVEVRNELRKRDDEVRAWAEGQDNLFLELETDIQRATSRVLATHPKLTGVGGQRNQADPFVIGMALARGATVVTEERPTGRLEKPRIPDVCHAMGVPWLDLVRFLEAEARAY